MNIFNVRKGFATNSSSSHSVIELKSDNGSYGVITDEYFDFGWEFFTAADKVSKENYIASCVLINLNIIGFKGEKLNKELIHLVGEDLAKIAPNVSMDHQSVITFPRNWDNKSLNKEFIQDVLKYVNKTNVVIVGGNDNTEDEHELNNDKISKLSPVEALKKERDNSHYIARKDGDYWSIFSRKDGEKVRFSFTTDEPPTKATYPELADIKITDFCPYNCDFCYQDSTNDGKNSNLADIKYIADELEKAQVYEVALGGGETTLHPNFVEILKIFKAKNIVPNFTTKNLNLLRQSNAKEIIKNCGAMAFSVQSVDEMMKVKTAYIDFKNKDDIAVNNYSWFKTDDKKPWIPKITFQIVLGVTSEKELKKMLELACDFGVRTTLLGYKENGRGASFAPHNYNNWLAIVLDIKKKRNINISIDTALASEFENELISNNVDKNTFHMNEGAFSIYIDAVKMTYAPSSYIGLEQSKPFDETWVEGYKYMNIKPTFKKAIKLNHS